MSARKRVVLFDDDPYHSPDEGALVEFRLTYAGPLLSTQRDAESGQRDRRAQHKHEIRKRFHQQLKKLWESRPPFNSDVIRFPGGPKLTSKELAERHSLYGFNFVPLVTEEISLLCGIDISMLRNSKPGSIYGSEYGGDIDNRLKTLLDALSIPSANEDYVRLTPDADEIPFYCLLENDKLITKVSVETDQLLEEANRGASQADVRLVIKVSVRPYNATIWNFHFG